VHRGPVSHVETRRQSSWHRHPADAPLRPTRGAPRPRQLLSQAALDEGPERALEFRCALVGRDEEVVRKIDGRLHGWFTPCRLPRAHRCGLGVGGGKAHRALTAPSKAPREWLASKRGHPQVPKEVPGRHDRERKSSLKDGRDHEMLAIESQQECGFALERGGEHVGILGIDDPAPRSSRSATSPCSISIAVTRSSTRRLSLGVSAGLPPNPCAQLGPFPHGASRLLRPLHRAPLAFASLWYRRTSARASREI